MIEEYYNQYTNYDELYEFRGSSKGQVNRLLENIYSRLEREMKSSETVSFKNVCINICTLYFTVDIKSLHSPV